MASDTPYSGEMGGNEGKGKGGELCLVLRSETAVLWQDWSQTGLDLGLGLAAVVLVLVVYFWFCFQFQHCCARQALCDMKMLQCDKHLYFFVQ